MLIKIVDDDQVFAKKIERMVYDGFKDIFLDYSIDCITSHFEDRYFEKGDIFFLDIDLKEKNGIKIAEEIRENNSNAIIIFVSAMNDMVFDSLIVQPFYFIRKDNFDRDMKIACTLIQKYINKLFKYSPLFKEYLKKFKGLKVDESRITPISYYDLQCAVYSNNTNFYTDDSATISNITDQKFIDAVQFVADLSIEGLASDYASAATSSAFTRFASQECLFSWMGPWDIATFWDGLSFEFDIMPVPKGDAEGAKSTTTIGTVAYSVSNASKNKPAAVLLAKWLACSETSATMNYKLGQAMPNIKQMAEDDWVNNKDLTGIYTYPESKSVFVDSIKGTSNMTGKSRAYYYTYEKTAYDDLMDQFNSVWSGQKSAKEVIDSYAQTFQDKLTKIHKNLE